jgi:hypothetical protein
MTAAKLRNILAEAVKNTPGARPVLPPGVYLVEKGLPVPGPTMPCKYPWDQMEVGDSFFVEGGSVTTLGASAYSAAKRLGWKFTTRTVPGGARSWRIK